MNISKIEDYLPYYIGQDIQTSDGSILKIASVHYGGWVNASGFLADGKQRVLKGYLSDEKLLLRPLSSMTREEAIQLADASLSNNSGVPFEYDCHYPTGVNVKVFWNERSVNYNIQQILFNALHPEAVHYLLKQGFDLFGLIEAGLAVDKTKEVTNGKL